MDNSTENEYPSEATVGDQWQRRETGKFREAVEDPLIAPKAVAERRSAE
jgi:hypothetical protein